MTGLARRLLAETLGTGLLVTVVVGSGIAAARLSPGDVGLQLLENALATALGLATLILTFGPVSGAHFNPVVSLADWWVGRRTQSGLTLPQVGAYTIAQTVGAIGGAVLANLMFGVPAGAWSQTDRSQPGLWLGEIVATTGLLLLILVLARTGRATLAAPAVGAYIGAAYWFTSSTSFANPAVTIGRAFTDTFAGIAPASVPGFVVAQAAGLIVALTLFAGLYGHRSTDPATANNVVTPRANNRAPSSTDRAANPPGRTGPRSGHHDPTDTDSRR